jgi:hypothetical protein
VRRTFTVILAAAFVAFVAGCWRSAPVCTAADGCVASDAGGDTDSDSDSDSDADTDIDTDTETASDTEECGDPCLDEEEQPIAGCLDPCGGWPDPEPLTCPDQVDFSCVTLSDVDDAPGMCLPAGSLGCQQSSDCACFPPFPACENASQETHWACTGSGQCAATCD